MRDYTIGYLIKKLREVGIINAEGMAGARVTLNNWIAKGILSFRRRPYSLHRIVNDTEVAEIIAALSSGGKGEWSAQGTSKDFKNLHALSKDEHSLKDHDKNNRENHEL